MKAQTPAEGILKTHDFGNSKYYQVVCSCGSDDDSIEFVVEADDMGVTVNTYTTQKTNFWEEPVPQKYWQDDPWYQEFNYVTTNIVNGFIRRCKLTWDIWFKGYVKYQSTTIMTEQQALNYAETLKSAIDDVKIFKAERKVKSATAKIAEQGDCI